MRRLPGAEVVVIGGGVIGTSIAYQLAKRGVEVALVERAGLAAGTSSGCDMAVQMQTKTPGAKLAFALESLALYRTLEEELGRDLEFANVGGMIVAETPAEVEYLRKKIASLEAHGLEIYFLDRDQVLEREPALGAHVCGASYCPLDSIVNSLSLTAAWADAAARLGARVYTHTPVTGVELEAERVRRVVTAAGHIEAAAAVDACGVWAPEIARMVGLDLPIVPRRGQLFVTEPAPPLVGTRVLAAQYLMSKSMPSGGDTKRMLSGVTFHQTRRGNFILGSTREFVGFDRGVTYEGLRRNMPGLIRLLPALKHLHVIRAFAGLRPASPDGLPIIERSSDIPNFYVAAGHEGDGIALSAITGVRMAELITGEIGEDVLAPFSSSRFADVA
jgi:glycine/D-amino acid oxidase-like deaminating enzyme